MAHHAEQGQAVLGGAAGGAGHAPEHLGAVLQVPHLWATRREIRQGLGGGLAQASSPWTARIMSACSTDGRTGPGRSCRNRITPQHRDGTSSCSRSEKHTHLRCTTQKRPHCSKQQKKKALTGVSQLPSVHTCGAQALIRTRGVHTCRRHAELAMSTCRHAPRGAVHAPLFSMASISRLRSGGAVSGGPNCSARSGSTEPEREATKTEAQSHKQEAAELVLLSLTGATAPAVSRQPTATAGCRLHIKGPRQAEIKPATTDNPRRATHHRRAAAIWPPCRCEMGSSIW